MTISFVAELLEIYSYTFFFTYPLLQIATESTVYEFDPSFNMQDFVLYGHWFDPVLWIIYDSLLHPASRDGAS